MLSRPFLTLTKNENQWSAFSSIKDLKIAIQRQRPYDLTYKWNLMNKTSEQPKYNQRHWNKEQNDSDQKGGGRGETGK